MDHFTNGGYMARNENCRCDSMTCKYCLQNRKPYFFTLSDGSAIYDIPVQKATNTGMNSSPIKCLCGDPNCSL